MCTKITQGGRREAERDPEDLLEAHRLTFSSSASHSAMDARSLGERTEQDVVEH